MVYVVQEPGGRNIVSAYKHGEVKVLLPPGSQITFSAGAVTNKLMRELSHFNDDDYLLLLGDPAAIGIAVAVASHWNQGRVRLLKWDRQEHMYYPVSFNINNKEGNSDDEQFGR